jgi:hypothetical protein
MWRSDRQHNAHARFYCLDIDNVDASGSDLGVHRAEQVATPRTANAVCSKWTCDCYSALYALDAAYGFLRSVLVSLIALHCQTGD